MTEFQGGVERIECLTSGGADALEAVHDAATDRDVEVNIHEVGESVDPEEGDILGVAVGGDGTFLEGVKEFAPRDIPMLAINTGTLGFLARISAEDTYAAVSAALDGNVEVIERAQLSVVGGGLDATGINDVMIQPTEPERPTDRKICRLHAWVGGEYAGQYDGSGLAISTPTGSTGVALSAGGPIHYPNNNHSLQLIPLNTHNIGVRPVIVDGDATVRIVPDDEVRVMVDGGRSHAVVDSETEMTITAADMSARIVRTEWDESFFDALSGVLGWGLRGVDDPGPY